MGKHGLRRISALALLLASPACLVAQGETRSTYPGNPSETTIAPSGVVTPFHLTPMPPQWESPHIRVRGIQGKDPDYRRMIDSLKKITLAVQTEGQVTLDGGGSPEFLSPTGTTNFEGVVQGNWIPGEPVVAVGPSNMVCVGNSSIRILSRTGTVLQNILAKTWYNMTDNHFDPKVIYDILGGRFLMLWAFQVNSPGPSNDTSFYLLSVSQTSDATGQWYNYVLDMRLDGSTNTTNWADYPGIGIDNNSVYLTANMYTFASNNFQYAKLRVLSKSSLYSGSTVGWTDFINMADVGGAKTFTLKPAQSFSSATTGYLLNTKSGGGSVVNFWKVTGGPGSPLLTRIGTLSVATYSVPPNAGQLGTSNLIRTNDCRTQEVGFRDGFVYTAWTIGTNLGDGNVAAVRFVKINSSNNSVVTDETYGASTKHYYYPAVTVDAAGSVFMGFGRSSSTEYASAWFAGKRPSETSLSSSTLLKSGVTGYTNTRWGDYTGISLDPLPQSGDSGTAWYSGQWTKGSNTWGSWIGKLVYTYGKIAGQALVDLDEDSTTTGDRVPILGETLQLIQGGTTIATTTSDSLGNYSFGYLESGTYKVVIVPSTYILLTVIPGSGGVSQARVGFDSIEVSLTNTQQSVGNTFVFSATPLPITLASFTAQINPSGPGVLLEWMTVSEVNNYGFFVERRRENEPTFTTISHLIPGAGTTTEPQYYSYVDSALTQTGLYHYRLRQLDLDGTIHYSWVIDLDVTTLAVAEAAPVAFRVFQNYPNPFNPKTTIRFSVETSGQTTVTIYTITGQEIARLFDGITQPGHQYEVEFDSREFSTGVYFYRISTPGQSVVRKMVLMK